MKLKRKLISCVCMFAVALTSLVVGVWALKTVDFSVGGNLSYVAPGIEATISKGTLANGTFVNSADASTKMPQTQITKTDTASTLSTKFAKWQNLSLAFNEAGDDTTITFSITNDMSSKYLVIDISTSYNSADNATISINTSSAVLEPSASQSFTITLAVTDKTADASLYGFSVVFNMTMSDSNPIVDLQYDSTNDYYYVEMGTYNNSAVRWKLVGVDGAKFTGSSAPASGTTGTFILETKTYTDITHAFGSIDDDWMNGNNDYSTSYIREYLTGNSSYALDWEGNPDNTDNGSFLVDFNISEDDAVYSAITAREITDLHKDIGWATGNVGGGQQYAPPAGTTTNATYDTTPKTSVGADKLWLMSVAEAYVMLGGGTIGSNGVISDDWSDVMENLDWDADSYDDYYWLRSPSPRDSVVAFGVGDDGDWYYNGVDFTYAVRPAFNVRFKYKAPGTLEYDSENNYYYVEMGTYQGDPVKWRLVGVDGERYTSSTKPTSGKGTFILETNTGIYQPFMDAPEGNNYATSDIRTYLNGDYITALNLANDATYNAITAREITDLHTDIGWAYSSNGTSVPNEGGDDAYAPPTGTKPNATYNTSVEGATGADKLWLMSVKEIYTLVGGGTLGADGTIPFNWSTYYDNLIWNEEYYWLRSPLPDISDFAFFVDGNGLLDLYVVDYAFAVRPAFNLVLGGGNSVEDEPAKGVSEYPTLQFYVTDSTNKTVSVQQNTRNKPTGELIIPSKVLSGGVEYTVTSIDYVSSGTKLSSSVPNKELTLPEMKAAEPEPDPVIGAFHLCSGITSITIPNSVTSIEYSAFSGCTGLTSITIPDSVTNMGDGTFSGCTGLTSITIPDSVTSIGAAAFSGCTNLTYNTYDNAKYLGNSTNKYLWLVEATSKSITSCTINSGCKVIYEYAFSGCTSLTSITIPDSVKSIGSSAFSGCTGLTSVTISNSVTNIGSSAFYNCTSLTSITIPESVISIGEDAFQSCPKLATVNVKATSVPTGGSNMFSNCSSSLKIYVPTASVSAYKAATYWSTYSSKIQGKSF